MFKVSALSKIAQALAATNPVHAARLLADAERTAQLITDEGVRALAQSEVAQALADTNPDHAGRIAQSITDKRVKASALSKVAMAAT